MRITSISRAECVEVLKRMTLGRLGCSLKDQPYIVPVTFSYETGSIYIFSTVGRKIEYMRQNPKVCFQVDEICTPSNWMSVIVYGTYCELSKTEKPSEREHALERLAEYSEWWWNALAHRQEKKPDTEIDAVFFRVAIRSMTGLRGTH